MTGPLLLWTAVLLDESIYRENKHFLSNINPFTPRVKPVNKCGYNFWVCGWNPSVWPFQWKLSSSTFMWYCLLCCARWFYLLSLWMNPSVWPFKWKLLSSTCMWHCLSVMLYKVGLTVKSVDETITITILQNEIQHWSETGIFATTTTTFENLATNNPYICVI